MALIAKKWNRVQAVIRFQCCCCEIAMPWPVWSTENKEQGLTRIGYQLSSISR